jgi:hypothetical protein
LWSVTDEHSVEDRPDSDLAKGKRARRALAELRWERAVLLLLASVAIVAFGVVWFWFH